MKAWFHKPAAETTPAEEAPASAPPRRGPRLDRALMIMILLMQGVIIALFFNSRRQPETLGSRTEVEPPPPTQGALVLPPAPLPQTAPTLTPPSPADEFRAMEAHFARMRDEMDRRMQENFPAFPQRTPFPASTFTPSFDREINRMMANALQEFRALENSAHFDEGWTSLLRSPALDMQDRDSYYLIVCSLPGLGQDEVQVTLEGRLLTIRGESSAHARQSIQHIAHYERRVMLPGPVADGEKAQASLANGVLRIMVPKADAMPQVARLTRLM